MPKLQKLRTPQRVPHQMKVEQKTTKKAIHEFERKPSEEANSTAIEKMHIAQTLPQIRCTCGAEILVLPDLEAMNTAILNHLAEHKKNNPEITVTELARVEDSLIEQILRLVAEMGE